MTSVLVERVAVVELVGVMNFPGLGPGAGIADGGIVAQFIGSDAREALYNLEGFGGRGRAAHADLAVEIGGLNHQSVAFPVAARVAQVGAEVLAEVRAVVNRNDARFVDHLAADDDVSGTLNDLVSEIVKSGQHAVEHATRDAAAVDIEIFPGVDDVGEMIARAAAAAQRFGARLGFGG